jgi:hypothetical protein
MAPCLPILLVLLGLLAPAQEIDPRGLRAALDLLREGTPGDPAFEAAAAKQLPLLIASPNDWFAAGGAYLAGKHRRVECVPDLLKALERENGRAPDRPDTSKRAILDALVVLEAQVPLELLMQRLEQKSMPETCLLLLRDQEHASEALLQLFDAADLSEKARWAAACALVSMRDERIAERLLAGMEWEFDVVVNELGGGHTSCASFGGSFWGSAHAAWPPRVTYDLRLPERGAALTPIQFARREDTRKGQLPGQVSLEERTALKSRLLETLLGDAEERALLRPSECFQMDWTDADAYQKQLQERCADLRDRLTRVALRLESNGLVKHAQELSARIVLRARLKDFREDRGTGLPAPPELPGIVFEVVERP